MKQFLLFLACVGFFLFTASSAHSQCAEGSLPVEFQFTTCCVENITNLVSYTIYNDAEEIVGQETLDISGAPGVNEFVICLPEGCYYTTLAYSAGFGTSAHLQSFEVLGENSSSFNIFQTSENIPFSFGFCVTAVPIECQAAFEAVVEDNGVVSVINNSTPTVGFTALYGWDYGDGSNTQGLAPDHTYSENGVYEICLFQALYEGDIPVCVSDICHTIEMNTVPNNSGCPTELIVTEGEICGQYIVEHNGTEAGSNYWFVDDMLESDANVLQQTFNAPGVHQVCLAHVSATCESSTTVCTTIANPDCANSNCPTQITYERTGCHTYVFHVNNLGNFGNMTWNFGDGETTGGQNNVTHTFDSLGVYNVCVMAYGTYCQSGVELCVDLNVAPCGGAGDGCQGEIYRTYESDCGHVHFESGTNSSNQPIAWNFGDGATANTEGSVIDHYYASPGIYTVTALMINEGCPNNATSYTIVTIDDCFNVSECPEGMYAGVSNNCHTWDFEIGSSTAGESVIWNFGDGEIVTGGHFISHTFTQNGVYEICGQYTSDLCPEGVDFCQTITVNCGTECTLAIEQISNACGFGVFEAITNVNAAEIHWSFNNSNTVLVGNPITVEAIDGNYSICAWYTSEGCSNSPEECTTVVINNCTGCTEVGFSFDSYINEGGTNYLNWNLYNTNNMTFVENGVAQYSANDPYYDHTVCLEDGCYVLTATRNEPFNFDAVDFFLTNADIVSIDALNLPGIHGYEILISVNGDCVSDCDIAGFNYVSYPSYEGMANVQWHLYNSADVMIMDGSHNFSELETSIAEYNCLEEDCYVLVFSGNQSFENNETFEYGISGYWTSTSVTYSNVGDQYFMEVSLNLNSNCSAPECALELTALEIEPGYYEFTATGNPEVYPMIWNFGDGETLEATWVTNHFYPTPGEYMICAHIQTEACGVVEACTTIVIEATNACDYSIWSGPGVECGDFIFEISGGAGLGPIVWTFGNEIVTDNQAITHHFNSPGTYVITASGSSNDCPNFYYTTTVVVPECETCSPTAVIFESNVLEGGTNCVAMSLLNLETNAVMTEMFEFSGNIMAHEWNECLASGCYALTFDSCLPIEAGSGLDFDIMVNGNSVLSNALVTIIDNYAMTITFGINSDCFNNDCNANFEVTTGNEPGQIVINNLSELAGEPVYTWNYGNGYSITGGNASYTYLQNGTYEVCLTASNNLCEDTYCTNITVSNSLCNETGVTVTLTSDYSQSNMSDALTVMVTVEDNVIGQFELTIEPFNTYPLAFCVPDGCYNVELISNEPIEALGIFANVMSNSLPLAATEILYGAYYGLAEFGINSDCGDLVSENELALIGAYPNPVNDQLQLTVPSTLTVSTIRLFDSFGRLVSTPMPNDRSVATTSLSNGMYFLHITTTDGVFVHKVEVAH